MSDEPDVYAICRHVKRYHEKNGYAPGREMIDCSDEFFEQLIKNDVLVIRPLYEGGTPVKVFLTDKGFRMANEERRRR